jgi:hypothetical protein
MVWRLRRSALVDGVAPSSHCSAQQEVPQEVRCALDLGSGATKMSTARFAQGRITEVILSRTEEILVREDVARRLDNSIGPDVLAQVRRCVLEMLREARAAGAVKVAAVATAVYRTSENGDAFIRQLAAESGVPIQIVDQSLEGALGFYTAAALAPPPATHTPTPAPTILAWDSGGGSFQLSMGGQGEGGVGQEELLQYHGACGSSTVFAWLLEIQGRDVAVAVTTNPASAREVTLLEERILREGVLPPPPPWLRGVLPDVTLLVCFGGDTSAFKTASVATGKETWGVTDLDEALERLCGHTDDELRAQGHLQPAYVLPKLTLVRAVFRHILPPTYADVC